MTSVSRAGVAVDKRGYIVVDDHLHTSVPGIWALGIAMGKAHSPTRPSTMLKLSGRIFWTMTRAKSAIALPLMLCILILRSAVQA